MSRALGPSLIAVVILSRGVARRHAGNASNFLPNFGSVQEVAVDYSSGTAEQAYGGVRINMIPRQGGNTLKGSFFATAVNSSFQGNNYTQDLVNRGLKTPNSINAEGGQRRPDQRSVQPLIGRPLSGSSTMTVNLVPPGAEFGERLNQLDMRVAKILKIRGLRTSVNLDLYNLFNTNAVLAELPTYTLATSTWRVPSTILTARFAKINVQFDF